LRSPTESIAAEVEVELLVGWEDVIVEVEIVEVETDEVEVETDGVVEVETDGEVETPRSRSRCCRMSGSRRK